MKINYYKESLKEIAALEKKALRPRLLLHACCGPCAVWPLEFLKAHFDITILYNNSNIYPAEEYTRRKEELRQYLDRLNSQDEKAIQLITPPYDNEAYNERLKPLKDEPERGKRCLLCYAIRMREGFEYARDHQFDYFTTVMTISRQKDSQVINEIGAKLALQFPEVRYFHSDFKKDDGILKANEIIQKNQMYRQDYCGCIYSWQKRQEKNAQNSDAIKDSDQ